ncbi:MAG: LysR substrate-binding domain-containing protein [Planctomycetota bacterium]
MRPTIAQIESFLAVAKTLNFRRAAAESYQSQSALSAQVQRLEELLGAKLLERDRRRVLLTDQGRDAVELAHRIIAATDELVGAMRAPHDQLHGSLRVGVIPTIAPHLVPRFLPSVQRAHPDLRLLLREDLTSRLVARVQSAELDVLLVDLDTELGNLHQQFLFDDAFVLAVRADHELADEKAVPFETIEAMELLLLEEGHCLSDRIRSVCRRAQEDDFCDFRATSLTMLVQMIAVNGGATLLPEMAAPDFQGVANLRLVPISPTAPTRRIGLAWRPGDGRASAFEALGERIEACSSGSSA